MIPTWLTISLWVLWTLWTLWEILLTFQIYRWNSSQLVVILKGNAYRNTFGKIKLGIYWILTILWFSWVFFG